MPRRLFSPLIGVTLLVAGMAAAAEPTLTPRAPPTALVPAAKSGAPESPPPRPPAPPNPVNVGTLMAPKPAPSFAAPPPPPPPAMVHAPVVKEPPKTITLKEVHVRGAAIKPSAADASTPPKALKTPEPPRDPARRRPAGDFSAWEKSCLLPDDLPPLSAPVKAGAKAQARVDVFMRRRPSCSAPILDVLEKGETVTAERQQNGWWRAHNPKWGSVWVGERLLAPLQQP